VRTGVVLLRKQDHELRPADNGRALDGTGQPGEHFSGEILLVGEAGLRGSGGAEARDRDPEGLRVGDAEDAGLAACVLAVQEVPAYQGTREPGNQADLIASRSP
jgi:hypothetical protein